MFGGGGCSTARQMVCILGRSLGQTFCFIFLFRCAPRVVWIVDSLGSGPRWRAGRGVNPSLRGAGSLFLRRPLVLCVFGSLFLRRVPYLRAAFVHQGSCIRPCAPWRAPRCRPRRRCWHLPQFALGLPGVGGEMGGPMSPMIASSQALTHWHNCRHGFFRAMPDGFWLGKSCQNVVQNAPIMFCALQSQSGTISLNERSTRGAHVNPLSVALVVSMSSLHGGSGGGGGSSCHQT